MGGRLLVLVSGSLHLVDVRVAEDPVFVGCALSLVALSRSMTY